MKLYFQYFLGSMEDSDSEVCLRFMCFLKIVDIQPKYGIYNET